MKDALARKWISGIVVGSGFMPTIGGTMTGQLLGAVGTAGAPGFSFAADANTGMWSPSADVIAWSTGGSERMRLTSSGPSATRLVMPTSRAPLAGVRISAFDGSGDDCLQLGYNLSDTIWQPSTLTEPMIWQGFESYFPNAAGRDPAFGTTPTVEMYWRYMPIGASGSGGGYVEPLFFNVDRATSKIIRGDIRAEHITLATTNDASAQLFLEMNINGSNAGAVFFPNYNTTMQPVVGVGGLLSGAAFTVHAADPLTAIVASTGTNRAPLRFVNTGGYSEIGRGGSTAFTFFTSGGSAYEFAIRHGTTGPINIGHTNVEITILNGGAVGINKTAPSYKLHVGGDFGIAPGVGTTVTPASNADLVIETTSNTTLTFKLKGSDGVVRTGTVTLA